MGSHGAAAQMVGYLYQVKYALYLILGSKQTNFKISLEKFDDISFENDESVVQMIQTKHHGTAGSLSDSSVDLWKTINVWLDEVTTSEELLSTCRFLIITTQTAAEHSAASLLRRDNRDEKKAMSLLQKVAQEQKNTALAEIYCKFLQKNPKSLTDLFKAVEVIDGAPTIADLDEKIRDQIRLCCFAKYQDKVMSELEGWWFRLAIEALCSPNHTLVDYASVRNKVVSIGQQYQIEDLPLEKFADLEISEDELNNDQRIFVQQLRLVGGNNLLIRRAVKNYYRAYQQRSNWMRENLLLPDELDEYDKRLVDEWEQVRALMEDCDDAGRQGRELYRQTMDKNITIRKRCTDPFVMRGSYEMLSDNLQVGWHRDYCSLLSSSKMKNRG